MQAARQRFWGRRKSTSTLKRWPPHGRVAELGSMIMFFLKQQKAYKGLFPDSRFRSGSAGSGRWRTTDLRGETILGVAYSPFQDSVSACLHIRLSRIAFFRQHVWSRITQWMRFGTVQRRSHNMFILYIYILYIGTSRALKGSKPGDRNYRCWWYTRTLNPQSWQRKVKQSLPELMIICLQSSVWGQRTCGESEFQISWLWSF